MTKKLVTILAEELPEWPEGAKEIGQWPLGEIVVKSMIRCKTLFIATQMADDQDSCYVTRAQWEAERARILLESRPERDPVIKEVTSSVSVGYTLERDFESEEVNRYEQELWDKVAISAYQAFLTNSGTESYAILEAKSRGACDAASAFMAERAKRMKG